MWQNYYRNVDFIYTHHRKTEIFKKGAKYECSMFR